MKKYLLALVGLCFLLTPHAYAALGFGLDTSTLTQNVNLTTVSTAITITTSSVSNLILLVDVWGVSNAGTSSVTSVTFGGSNLTKLVATSTASTTWQLWYLLNPATGAGHATTTFNESQNAFEICAQDFYGVNQTTPFDASSSNIVQPSVTVVSTSMTTATSNDWIASFVADNAGAGSGSVSPAPSTGDYQVCSGSTGGEHAGSGYRLIPTAQTTSTGWQNGSSTYGMVAGSMVLSDVTVVETTSTTWVAPTGVTSVTVRAWGGGGGGGKAGSKGGAGGGGGAFAQANTVSVTPGNSYTVTVGTPGLASGSDSSTAGGASWFSTTTLVYAAPGNPGLDNSTAIASGGTVASSTGDIKFKGGSGGGGAAGDVAGGGGGGAGAQNNGTAAPGLGNSAAGAGGAVGGGAGGAGGHVGNSNGGGGGGGVSTVGFAGAQGEVDIIYTAPAASTSTALTPYFKVLTMDW